MSRRLLAGAAFALLAAVAAPAFAEPSLNDIYTATNAGRLDDAQRMVSEVLEAHPESAKAHYVAAEVNARQGKRDAARSQLQKAEQLAPGLPFAKPESVRGLKAQLGESSGGNGASRAAPVPQKQGGIGAGAVLGLIAVGVVVFLLMRRRRVPPPAAMPTSYGAPNPYGAPGQYPGQYPPAQQGGGIGSGIAGGLASGLAVGAGVVAGEALAHRLMGDGERERVEHGYRDDPNSNMGGSNFGVSDSSGWDDNSGGVSDSGGGDDWS